MDSVLQRGGMGVVYRGHHGRTGAAVAIKTMLSPEDPVAAVRFAREAELMSRIRHPNVVAILEYGLLEEGPCIVMEFVEGSTLRATLEESGGLAWPEASQLMIGILAGLGALHQSKIVHRDLKPSNVVVTPGEPRGVRLLDLGIARSSAIDAPSVTTTGGQVGTVSYMSPEQLRGDPVDFRSDLYSASILLYEMLTGAPLVSGKNVAAVYERLHRRVAVPVAPSHLPRLPDPLLALLLSGLEVSPESRPISARLYASSLERIRSEAAVVAQPQGALPRAEPPPLGARLPTDTTATRVRMVFVARLPVRAFSDRAERAWLQTLPPSGSRSYVVGTNIWLVLGPSQNTLEVDRISGGLNQALTARFGVVAQMRWRAVIETYKVSQGAIVGAQPMPPPIAEMIEDVCREAQPPAAE